MYFYLMPHMKKKKKKGRVNTMSKNKDIQKKIDGHYKSLEEHVEKERIYTDTIDKEHAVKTQEREIDHILKLEDKLKK